MNLLKELAPYSTEINAYARGFGMSNTKVLNKLIDIWDKWKNLPEVSKRIYGSPKTTAPTDRGCGNCSNGTGVALKGLLNWKKELEKTGHYKLVPQGSKSKREIDKNPKKLEPKKDSKPNLQTMKWGEIRELAKKHKLKIHGKKKPDLIKELEQYV